MGLDAGFCVVVVAAVVQEGLVAGDGFAADDAGAEVVGMGGWRYQRGDESCRPVDVAGGEQGEG